MNRIVGPWRVLTAGALALAVLGAGIAVKARGEDKKPAPKKEDAAKKEANPLPDVDELMKKMGTGLDPNILKDLRQRMEESQKRMEKMLKELQNGGGQGGLEAFPAMPLLPGFGGPGVIGRANRSPAVEEPRLGAQVRKPSQTLEDQLDLPKDQGMVVEEVGANSAAAKAGMKRHDILLELNGKPVPSKKEDFVKLLESIKAKTPVDAVVMRKGKKETLKGLALPEARAAAPAERPAPFPAFPGGRLMAPAFGGLGGFGALDGSTSISRTNDAFTVKNSTGDATITVKGKVEAGKPQVSEVTIKSNDKTKTYDNLDQVPAEYKERVKKLVQMGAKGGFRFSAPIGADF